MDNNTNTDETVKNEELEKVENYDDYDYDDSDNQIVEEQVTTTNTSRSDDNEFRDKIINMFKIVLIALIIILVIGFIISLFSKKKYTYSSVEDVMKDAAISYFKDNSSKLPKTDDEIVEIGVDILVNNGYMKKLDHYIKNEDCSGKVNVERVSTSKYNYIPILSCENYTTTSLIDEIRKKSNIVEEGYGVYYLNGEYVYRGLEVNNYVKFSDSNLIWRIVKVTNDNEVVLISNYKTTNTYPWDSRYNNTVEDTSGISTYHNSSISSILNKLYNGTLQEDDSYYEDEIIFLTDYDKTKIVEFDSCVGTRSKDDTTEDGSTECAVTEKSKMSLLPVYDFMNASIDNNCNSTLKPDCQNYNYLNAEYSYWLANGDSENTDKVYMVSSYIYTRIASYESVIRPVIHLNSSVMVESGKGTLKNPYVIR